MVNVYPYGRYVCHEAPNKGDVRRFDNGLARWSGTSFSCPLVAGLIAARMSVDQQGAKQARDAVLAEARQGSDPVHGKFKYLPRSKYLPSYPIADRERKTRRNRRRIGVTIASCGSRRRTGSPVRAAGRPRAARRRVVPRGRGRQGRAGRRQRGGQDHPAEDHHRRADAERRRGDPLRRARCDAPDGRQRPRRRPERRRPPAVGLAGAGPGGGRRGRPVRAGADGDRRRGDPDALRHGARRLRRRRRLRARGRLGRLHRQGPGRALRPREVPLAQDAVGRRAEAAGAGVPARRSRRGAAARRARQLPRRARQDLAGGADPRVRQDHPLHQPRPRAARTTPRPGSSPSSSGPPATWSGPTRAASRRTTRRARTGSSAWRSCAAAGTRSTPSSGR